MSGETHRYLGRQYRLKVVEAGAAEVKMRGRFIWVQLPQKGDTAQRGVAEPGAGEDTGGLHGLCGHPRVMPCGAWPMEKAAQAVESPSAQAA
ncbi:MAG: hypothetical protein WCO56_03755 [Verrucomicrobiota bacterium]